MTFSIVRRLSNRLIVNHNHYLGIENILKVRNHLHKSSNISRTNTVDISSHTVGYKEDSGKRYTTLRTISGSKNLDNSEVLN